MANINPEFVELITKNLDENKFDNDSEAIYMLPFETIADLNATAHIRQVMINHDKSKYKFYIELDNVSADFHCNQYGLYTSKWFPSVADVLQDFMDFTDKVVIDKLNGKLVTNKDTEKEGELLKEFCDLFISKNMSPTFKECCVCYAPTRNKTDCKHNICIACVSSLPLVEADDDDCSWKKCPMCRENIEFYS